MTEDVERPEGVEDEEPETWLIFSTEHEAWWRPNSRGYTTDIMQAGFYTERRAKAQERMIPENEFAIRADQAFAILAAERWRTKERGIEEFGGVRVQRDRLMREAAERQGVDEG